MKRIKLTKGKFTLVDDSDYKELIQYKWNAKKGHSTWYAQRGEWCKINKVQYMITMHRHLLKPDKNLLVDHINRNGLDNRRENLRICTKSENNKNSMSKLGTSSYTGVSWKTQNNNWIAQINIEGKRKHIGSFDNELEAAKAYNKAAKEYHGEFACINIIKEN